MLQNLYFFVAFNVVVYSSFVYAVRPLWDIPPPQLQPNTEKYCYGWMQHHDILNKEFDRVNHVYAACYAYFISAFRYYSLQKQKYYVDGYCYRVDPHNQMSRYKSLQDTTLSCPNWIHYYGYLNDNKYLWDSETYESPIAFMEENIKMATYRFTEEDNVPHFLVAMYSTYISDTIKALENQHFWMALPYDIKDHINEILSPFNFCVLLENLQRSQTDPLPYAFATLDTPKSCHEWIHLNYYSDNVDENIEKARTQNKEVIPYLSKWTIDYINEILFNYENDLPYDVNPVQYCTSIGLPPDNKVYYKRF